MILAEFLRYWTTSRLGNIAANLSHAESHVKPPPFTPPGLSAFAPTLERPPSPAQRSRAGAPPPAARRRLPRRCRRAARHAPARHGPGRARHARRLAVHPARADADPGEAIHRAAPQHRSPAAPPGHSAARS